MTGRARPAQSGSVGSFSAFGVAIRGERVYASVMFEALAEAIDEVEIPVDGDALVEAFALCDRLQAKLSAAAGDFDAASLWDLDAATSLTAWLRHRAGMTARDAGRASRQARRLRALPVTAAAYGDGSLSGGQVRAVLANLTDATAERFAAHEAAIVPALGGWCRTRSQIVELAGGARKDAPRKEVPCPLSTREDAADAVDSRRDAFGPFDTSLLVPLSVTDTAAAMRHWAARAQADLDAEAPAEAAEPVRTLHLSTVLDGRRVLDGNLDADSGAVVATALRVADTLDTPDTPDTPGADRADGTGCGAPRSPATRRADALTDICRFFLDHQHQRPGGRHRPHLDVIVRVEDLVPEPAAASTDGSGGDTGHRPPERSGPGPGAVYADGQPVSPATLGALACDSALHRVLVAGRSSILDYGHATPHVPGQPVQRRGRARSPLPLPGL